MPELAWSPIVVSNTSPIVNLARIKQVDLLKQLYGKIIIPQAVYDEIVVAGSGQPGVEQVQARQWIETRQLTTRTLASSLTIELDPGEAEAIALALELKASLLLVDEKRGRKVAERFGLRRLGLCGLLIEAKSKSLIVAVKPVLDDLITEAGFRVSPVLYRRVLETARE